MATHQVRRRRTAFAGGLAIVALCLGFTASPAGAAPPAPVDYVAIGDSYTAGTGAGGLYADSLCWRSEGGYVDLANAAPRINLVANAACHGAFIFAPVPEPVPTPVSQQIAQMGAAMKLSEETDLVSITAGALDAGSLQALAACASQDTVTCEAVVNQVIGNLGVVKGLLMATYESIHTLAPNATIAVLGYPRLFAPNRGDIVVGNNVVVPVENQIQVNRAIDALNATIAAAVKDSGEHVIFIDVTKRFQGHAVNSDDPWIVLELAPVPPFTYLPDANFHPNDAGHLAYASALLSQAKPAQLSKR